jgi:hypothetical protein
LETGAKGNEMNFSMNETINELRAGICELTLVDEFSVEYDKVMGTLAECHMADLEGVEKSRREKNAKGGRVNVWNVRKERWEEIRLVEIGEIERLTGRGVGKRNETEMSLKELQDAIAEGHELINIPMGVENAPVSDEKNGRMKT